MLPILRDDLDHFWLSLKAFEAFNHGIALPRDIKNWADRGYIINQSTPVRKRARRTFSLRSLVEARTIAYLRADMFPIEQAAKIAEVAALRLDGILNHDIDIFDVEDNQLIYQFAFFEKDGAPALSGMFIDRSTSIEDMQNHPLPRQIGASIRLFPVDEMIAAVVSQYSAIRDDEYFITTFNRGRSPDRTH